MGIGELQPAVALQQRRIVANKRVLHLINGEFYAGAERVQDLLALGLPEFGFDCGFACLKPKVFDENRRAKSVPLHAVPMRSRVDLSAVRAVRRLLLDGRYDLLHTHTVRGAMIGRAAAVWAGVPMVHHVHSPTRRDTENGSRNRLNALVEEHLVLPGARRLIAVSQSLGDYLKEIGVASSRIRVVPNGVPTVSEACAWRHPSGDWVVGMVALFRPRKGLEVLLQALASLRQQGVQARLLAVGGFESPEYEHTIRALATLLGLDNAIEWTGFTKDVGKHLARMDVFALPSLFGEGLPMVVIEAMAAGRPVVASRVEGIAEVLGVDNAGVIVEPGDAEDLARGIRAIIDMGPAASALAEAGHRRQRDHFSDRAMARGVATVYREVLGLD